MKKGFIFMLMILLAVVVFAGGEKEVPLDNIRILVNGGGEGFWLIVEDMFSEKYPEVMVEYLTIDLSTGATISMDTMVAQGDAPDVYKDFLGRTGKYMLPDFALNLSEAMDLSDFYPAMLASLSTDGVVYGLPGYGGYQGLMVNLDLLAEIGGELPGPDGWTISEFLDLAEKCKAEGKYVTGMFAGNQSGDYLYMNWFAAFGAEMYTDGYAESALDTPEGLATIRFWKHLYDKGYIPKESSVLTDDDYVLQVVRGEILAGAFYPPWAISYFDVVAEQGYEPFNYAFLPFPHAANIERTPACGNFTGIVGMDSGNKKKNEMIIYLLECITSLPVQGFMATVSGAYPTRKSVTAENDDMYWKQINSIVGNNGYYDLGIALPIFGEIRKQMFPLNQELFNGKLEPEEVLEKYIENVNILLAE